MKMNISEATNNMPVIQSRSDVRESKLEYNQKQDQELQTEVMTKEKMKTTVDTLNEFLEPNLHNVHFVFHDDLDKYYVTVVDPLTDEIIREIPPKKMLDMYAAMAEYMGLLVDEKV